MRHGSWMVVSALVFSARAADASSLRCWGSMRTPDCRELATPYEWRSDTQPTFVVECESCPSPNDAGYTCMPWAPYATQFSLTVGGQSYRNGGIQPDGDGRYFEDARTKCGAATMFRYKGPLVPGLPHTIDLGGHSYPKLPIEFQVVSAPPAPAVEPRPEPRADDGGGPAPVRDAGAVGAPFDAAADGTAHAPPEVRSSVDLGADGVPLVTKPGVNDGGGCSCALGARRSPSALVFLVVAAVALLRRRQPSRRPNVCS